MASTEQTNAIPVPCEAASMRHSGRRLAGRGGSGNDMSAIGARPDSTARCGKTRTHSINQVISKATPDSFHRIGTAVIGR
jgi:hypothetical protein